MFVISRLSRETGTVVALAAGFVLLQIVAVLLLAKPQSSDAATYLELARRAIAYGSWHPPAEDIRIVFAPGYVNYLVVLMRDFGFGETSILLMNVVLNVILLALIYAIASEAFSKRIGVVAAAIFTCTLSNYGVPLTTLSEQLYTVAAYGSLWLVLRGRFWTLVAAGILLAFANWVRPVGIVFFLASIAVIVARVGTRRRLIPYAAGCLVCVLLIGAWTYDRIGYFNFQSSTGGVNLLMGANDDMTGGFEPSVFKQGKIGYVENIEALTFKERNDFFTTQALAWIKQHPWKYLAYLPIKTYILWNRDSHFVGYLFGTYELYVKNGSTLLRATFFTANVLHQLFYAALLLLAGLSLVVPQLRRSRYTQLLWLIIALGTAITVVTVGIGRYHYPYMPAVTILAAASLATLWARRTAVGSWREMVRGVADGRLQQLRGAARERSV